jgi:hypothetical protein
MHLPAKTRRATNAELLDWDRANYAKSGLYARDLGIPPLFSRLLPLVSFTRA